MSMCNHLVQLYCEERNSFEYYTVYCAEGDASSVAENLSRMRSFPYTDQYSVHDVSPISDIWPLD